MQNNNNINILRWTNQVASSTAIFSPTTYLSSNKAWSSKFWQPGSFLKRIVSIISVATFSNIVVVEYVLYGIRPMCDSVACQNINTYLIWQYPVHNFWETMACATKSICPYIFFRGKQTVLPLLLLLLGWKSGQP